MKTREAIEILIKLECSLDEYCGLNERAKTAFCMAVEALEIYKKGAEDENN